jgi:hypothetical protein
MQREVKHTSMDKLDSPTIQDGCMATNNGRTQKLDGRCFLLGQPDAIMEVGTEVSSTPRVPSVR